MRLNVADIFSDHMALRHSRPDPVWGRARPGAKVSVRMEGARTDCVAGADGRWIAWIDAPPAGVVGELAVESEGERVVFRDVACGEVYLAAGQSNMEQPLMCMEGALPWAERAARAQVRLKRIPRRCGWDPEPGWHFFPDEGIDSPWVRADRLSAARFSAIGYVFAAKLSERLDMPVGVIECNWGGTMIQPWMAPDDIRAHADTRADLGAFLAAREALGNEAAAAFEKYVATVRRAALNEPDYVDHDLHDPLNFLKEDRGIAFVPYGAVGDPQMPGLLFDSMIRRVAPYALDGVLWYQGEANGSRGEAHRYAELFRRMAESWRGAWMDAALPFITCQLAGFDTSLYWGDGADWPTLRARQQACADQLQGVSMAVLIDVGMERNIHPLRKEPVAERLCRLALEELHGIPADARAPRPVCAERIESGVRLRFDVPVTLREGESPVLLSQGQVLASRAAQPEPRTLILSAETVPDAVSYAWRDWLVPGLFGQNALPVGPFMIRL